MLADKLDIAAKALGLKPDTKSRNVSQSQVNSVENIQNDSTYISRDNDIVENQSDSSVKGYDTKSESESGYAPDPFTAWLKDNWIMKLGVFLICIIKRPHKTNQYQKYPQFHYPIIL